MCLLFIEMNPLFSKQFSTFELLEVGEDAVVQTFGDFPEVMP